VVPRPAWGAGASPTSEWLVPKRTRCGRRSGPIAMSEPACQILMSACEIFLLVALDHELMQQDDVACLQRILGPDTEIERCSAVRIDRHHAAAARDAVDRCWMRWARDIQIPTRGQDFVLSRVQHRVQHLVYAPVNTGEWPQRWTRSDGEAPPEGLQQVGDDD